VRAAFLLVFFSSSHHVPWEDVNKVGVIFFNATWAIASKASAHLGGILLKFKEEHWLYITEVKHQEIKVALLKQPQTDG
jgi:hypothetical protein